MTTELQQAEEIPAIPENSRDVTSGETKLSDDGDHKNQVVTRPGAGNPAEGNETTSPQGPVEGGAQVKAKEDHQTDVENTGAETPTNAPNNENKQEPTGNEQDRKDTGHDAENNKNTAPLGGAGTQATSSTKADHVQERQKEIDDRAQKLEKLKEERQERERAAKELEEQKRAALSKKRKEAADNRLKLVQALVKAAKDAEEEAQSGKVLILQMDKELKEAQNKVGVAEEAIKGAQDAKSLLEKSLETANNRADAADKAVEKAEEDKAQLRRDLEDSVKKAGEAAAKAQVEKDDLRKNLREKADELIVVNSAVIAAKRAVDIAKQDVAKANARADAATKANEAAQKEVQKLKASVATLDAKLIEAKKSLEELDNVKAQLEAANKSVRELEGQLETERASSKKTEALLAECAKDHGNALAVWPRGGSRVSNVLDESPGKWWEMALTLPGYEDEARRDIDARLSKLKNPPELCAKLATSSNPSIKWIDSKKSELQGYQFQQSRRLPLTSLSSIDVGEVTCPSGMVVIGVALGPWMGENSTKPVYTHMSIKLLCRGAGDDESKAKLYGNQGPKYTAEDMGNMIARKVQATERRNATPWPPSTFANIFCDNREVTYEAFVGKRSDEVVDTKAISSLSFYNPRFNNAGKLADNRLYLLPTWQDLHRPRIVATPEAIVNAFKDDDGNSSFYFRRPDQLGPSEHTTSGIDRLYYDTNVVGYNGWQVTGVQIFVRDNDTLALNVRFQNLPPK